ncbi:type VI secretion system baseplate subunit TssG, partial [Bordetella bronchiseptica]
GASPRHEPVRMRQEPSLAFAPATLAAARAPGEGAAPELSIYSFGLFGPNGPLPLHLTEHARERRQHHGDHSLAAFADLFHHRLILLFYRAWADAQSTASLDRGQERFSGYVASLLHLGAPSLRRRDSVMDHAKYHMAGHLLRQTRNPEGLCQVLRAFFGLPVGVDEFVAQWIRLEAGQRLRQRLKGYGKAAVDAPVRRVHVVGAGVMGGDIAAWCAYRGLTVTLQDQDMARIAPALARAGAFFARKLKDRRAARAAFDRLVPDPQGDGVAQADLVIEAISENAQAKQALYRQLEPRLKPGALLATNTSSLSLAGLAQVLDQPQRLVGIHFFNPVARMPLVEVVLAADGDPRALARACAFVGRIGKLPLPVRDAPGFLVNAVLAPYMLEAMRCVDEGMAPAAIDAAMAAFGMPMGPLELADTVGLDIAAAAGAQLTGEHAPPRCLAERLARKELGRKSGRGFYAWRDGKAVKPAARGVPPGLVDRLLQPLIDSARERVAAGVVADADLADAGAIFGTGFAPYTGGPLQYASQREAVQRP